MCMKLILILVSVHVHVHNNYVDNCHWNLLQAAKRTWKQSWSAIARWWHFCCLSTSGNFRFLGKRRIHLFQRWFPLIPSARSLIEWKYDKIEDYTLPCRDSQCFHLTIPVFFADYMAIDYQELTHCEHCSQWMSLSAQWRGLWMAAVLKVTSFW